MTNFSKAIPTNFYLFKVNNRNTRKKVWNMFKVDNKDNVVVFLLLILNIFYIFSRASITRSTRKVFRF